RRSPAPVRARSAAWSRRGRLRPSRPPARPAARPPSPGPGPSSWPGRAAPSAVGAEPVPRAAQGLGVLPTERLVHLAPQAPDVHLDDVGIALEVVVPDVFEDLRLGHHI